MEGASSSEDESSSELSSLLLDDAFLAGVALAAGFAVVAFLAEAGAALAGASSSDELSEDEEEEAFFAVAFTCAALGFSSSDSLLLSSELSLEAAAFCILVNIEAMVSTDIRHTLPLVAALGFLSDSDSESEDSSLELEESFLAAALGAALACGSGDQLVRNTTSIDA